MIDIVKGLESQITKDMKRHEIRQQMKKREKAEKALRKLTVEEIKLLDEIYNQLMKESIGNTWDRIEQALYKVLRSLRVSDMRIKKAFKLLVEEVGGEEHVNMDIQEQEG